MRRYEVRPRGRYIETVRLSRVDPGVVLHREPGSLCASGSYVDCKALIERCASAARDDADCWLPWVEVEDRVGIAMRTPWLTDEFLAFLRKWTPDDRM